MSWVSGAPSPPPRIRLIMTVCVRLCLCVGGLFLGGHTQVQGNFSSDYMNWLSVQVEARHAGPYSSPSTP